MGIELILFLVTLILGILFCFTFGHLVIKQQSSKGSEKQFDDFYKKIRDEIRFSIQPMSDIPMGVEDITELAVEVWKIEQRLSKVTDSISDIHRKGLDSSIQRLKRYLQKFDVEIQDYTGQKYNDGFNFDILSREQDASLACPMIKETVEPTITCRGRVVKKAKVILASNQI